MEYILVYPSLDTEQLTHSTNESSMMIHMCSQPGNIERGRVSSNAINVKEHSPQNLA